MRGFFILTANDGQGLGSVRSLRLAACISPSFSHSPISTPIFRPEIDFPLMSEKALSSSG
jgi:hypothetical protein